MNLLLDPNLAYALLMFTLLLITLAILVPGTGVIEVIALVVGTLAGYTLLQQTLRFWAAIVLLLGGVCFGVAMWRRKLLWLLPAWLGLLIGSLFLFEAPGRVIAVHPLLALSASLLLGGYFWFGVRKGIEVLRTKPPAHTLEQLLGQVGETRTPVHHEGSVYVNGELWSARSRTPIPAGKPIRVVGREGLTLLVAPLEETPETTGE